MLQCERRDLAGRASSLLAPTFFAPGFFDRQPVRDFEAVGSAVLLDRRLLKSRACRRIPTLIEGVVATGRKFPASPQGLSGKRNVGEEPRRNLRALVTRLWACIEQFQSREGSVRSRDRAVQLDGIGGRVPEAHVLGFILGSGKRVTGPCGHLVLRVPHVRGQRVREGSQRWGSFC